MIEFPCPNCGRSMRVQDDAAGKTGQCKNCGTSLAVPVPKRIFEEQRFRIAAVGGLVAIQGIVFTIIDAGLFSVSVTMLGLVIAAGGLHVEVRALLMRVSDNLPVYRARIKEAFERFCGKAGAVLLWMSTNISRCAGRINETTKERIQQFKQQQAHRAAIRELKKQQARDSMKSSEAPTECVNEMPLSASVPVTQQQIAERNQFEMCLTENQPADAPTLSDSPALPFVPELSLQDEADPFADLVEAQATQTTPSDLPLAAGVPPLPPSVVAERPQRVQCPYCGELIVADAIKCRFCNEYVDGRSVALLQPTMQVHQSRKTHDTSESIEEYEVWRGHPYCLRHNPVLFWFYCLLIPVFGLGLLMLLHRRWLSLSKTLIVTNRRTILQTRLNAGGQKTQEVRHEDIQYLEVKQTGILNDGTIVISTAAQRGEIEIDGIFDPQAVKEMIDQFRNGDGQTASRPLTAKRLRLDRSKAGSVSSAILTVVLGLALLSAILSTPRQPEKPAGNREAIIGANAPIPVVAHVLDEPQIPDDSIQPFPTVAGQRFLKEKLVELDAFKKSSQFHFYGFGIGGPYNSWIKATGERRNDETFSIFEKSALVDLQNLGFEYIKTEGRENEFTRSVRSGIVETINKPGAKNRSAPESAWQHLSEEEVQEKKAAAKLALAKQFILKNRTENAVEWLRQVVAEFPGTSAAEEAKQLLDK